MWDVGRAQALGDQGTSLYCVGRGQGAGIGAVLCGKKAGRRASGYPTVLAVLKSGRISSRAEIRADHQGTGNLPGNKPGKWAAGYPAVLAVLKSGRISGRAEIRADDQGTGNLPGDKPVLCGKWAGRRHWGCSVWEEGRATGLGVSGRAGRAEIRADIRPC